MALTLVVGYIAILFGVMLTSRTPPVARALLAVLWWIPYLMLVLYIGGKV